MTTFAIIALTVLGTIGVEILILVLAVIFDKDKSIEQMDAERGAKFLSDTIHSSEGFEFVDLSKVPELKELTDNELGYSISQKDGYYDLFKKLNSNDTEPTESYLENLPKYKDIIDKTPNEFLNYHFQNSIRDEQYELSQYISDVAKERGMILKVELN